jgi:subtilase family serine protease
MRKCRVARSASVLVDQLEDRCLMSRLGRPQVGGYTPAEITAAYGLNAITFTSAARRTIKGNGAGETIALIEEYHDPRIRSDLHAFDRTYDLPDPSLTVLDQAGSRTNNSWALEESMDVEWAHAIAPGAKILVVEAAPANSQTSELESQLNAVNTARKMAGVVVISMSWGFAEMPNESVYDSYFTTPAGHAGVTFVASSGDYGFSWYPSASPNVLSVGGTSLFLTNSGTYQSETAWFWSGGGYSPFEPEPGDQSSVQMTGERSTPDVSFDANSTTGVAIYETPPRSGKGSWHVYGGTSLGAPVWAGIIAIVDQGRALTGKGSLDGPSQTLPALYALPKSDFKPVTPNDGFLDSGGLSSLLGDLFGTGSHGATANIATGLGSPNGPSLVADLVASEIGTVPVVRNGRHL